MDAGRADAFNAWNRGVLSDEQLKRVIRDLTAVVEVFEAMGRGSEIVACWFRNDLAAAVRMKEGRGRT